MVVEFLKKGQVNGTGYKKGDTLSVSSSIAKRLINDEKCAKEFKEESKDSNTEK